MIRETKNIDYHARTNLIKNIILIKNVFFFFGENIDFFLIIEYFYAMSLTCFDISSIIDIYDHFNLN
jgi:hypothetical protein